VNATSVTITPGGAIGQSGSVVVTPATTTTTSSRPRPEWNHCFVQRGRNRDAGNGPQIITFSAVPATINSGQTSTLVWAVQNATNVSIAPSRTSVSLTGSQVVSPTATTTYTLTATNAAAGDASTSNRERDPAAVITSFTANPNPSPSPGSAVCSVARRATLSA